MWNLTDSDLKNLVKACESSPYGPKIKRLYHGDSTGYKSVPKALLAFCTLLAPFCDKNPEQLDRIVRASDLFKEGWDDKRKDWETNGQLIIEEAIANCNEKLKHFGASVRGVTLDDLAKEYSSEPSWIWRQHIPEGEPSMIAAREGTGKTTICLQMAKEMCELDPGHIVAWLATEGAVRNTVQQAKQIGLSNLSNFRIAQKKDDDFGFNLASKTDRALLDEFLTNFDETVIAVFVDSLRGAFPSNNENEPMLGNMMREVNKVVCDKNKSALIWIHHENKQGSKAALNRVSGNTSITAAVRHVLSIKKKTDLIRTIKCSKSNIDDTIPGLEAVKCGNKIIINQAGQATDETQSHKTEVFLTQMFSQREKIPATEIYDEGEKQGLSSPLLKKVKKKIGIESQQCKEEKRWFWVWSIRNGDSGIPYKTTDDNNLES